MLKIICFALMAQLLTACAGQPERVVKTEADAFGSKDYAESLVSSVKPRWFNTVERFQLQREGAIQPHMFFDVFPSLNKQKKVINFIVTTPQNFPTEQELDLSSGQHYLGRKFCSRSDAWGEYKGEIYLPPFTTGIVPRVLDQLNLPQKIIVFGQDGYYQKHFKSNYFDARIIGAYVERICPQRGCADKNSWLSRLALVGVQKDNKKYQNVHSVEDLKKIVDWKKTKAFIENSGMNSVGGRLYPAFQMGAIVDASQAFYFLKENSHFFNNDDLKKMRIGCYKLYDHLWRNYSKSDASSFYAQFRENFLKYHKQYNTCSKYIYPSSINDDPKRHWFFVYLTGFHRMNKLGYFYDCSKGAWTSNPVLEGGKRAVSMKERFKYCSARHVNEAMKKMPRYLEVLKERSRNTYRYIDYDNSSWGAHSKLYSWVKHDNKVLTCSKDKDGNHFKIKLPTFPKDVKWTDILDGKK